MALDPEILAMLEAHASGAGPYANTFSQPVHTGQYGMQPGVPGPVIPGIESPMAGNPWAGQVAPTPAPDPFQFAPAQPGEFPQVAPPSGPELMSHAQRDPDEIDTTSDDFMKELVLGVQERKASTPSGGVYMGGLKRAISGYEDVINQRAALAEETGKQMASAVDQIGGITEAYRIDQEELATRRQEAEAEAMGKLDEAKLLRQYGGLNLEEIESYKDTLASSTATAEQKAAAQRALDKAEAPDPGKFWDDKSAFGKAFAAIAIGMGAAASVTEGGPNLAYKIINDAIERDLASQAAKFQKRGYAVRDAQNYVQLVSRQFDKEEDRLLAAKSLMLEDASLQMKKMEMMSNSADKKMAFAQSAAQMKMEAEQFRIRVAQNASQFAAKMGLENRKLAMAMRKATAVKALPAQQAANLAAKKEIRENIEDLRKSFFEKTGPTSMVAQFIPYSSEREYEDERKLFAQLLAKAVEKNRISDQDRKFYLELVPKASTTDSRANAFFGMIANRLRSSIQSDLEAFGRAGLDTSQFQDYVEPTGPIGNPYE